MLQAKSIIPYLSETFGQQNQNLSQNISENISAPFVCSTIICYSDSGIKPLIKLTISVADGNSTLRLISILKQRLRARHATSWQNLKSDRLKSKTTQKVIFMVLAICSIHSISITIASLPL